MHLLSRIARGFYPLTLTRHMLHSHSHLSRLFVSAALLKSGAVVAVASSCPSHHTSFSISPVHRIIIIINRSSINCSDIERYHKGRWMSCIGLYLPREFVAKMNKSASEQAVGRRSRKHQYRIIDWQATDDDAAAAANNKKEWLSYLSSGPWPQQRLNNTQNL